MRFADRLRAADGVEVVNDVVLNQVLVRFGSGSDAKRDAATDRVIDAVQRSGECWMGATTWHGMRLMRISVSSWSTTEGDVDRSVAAILAAAPGLNRRTLTLRSGARQRVRPFSRGRRGRAAVTCPT